MWKIRRPRAEPRRLYRGGNQAHPNFISGVIVVPREITPTDVERMYRWARRR